MLTFFEKLILQRGKNIELFQQIILAELQKQLVDLGFSQKRNHNVEDVWVKITSDFQLQIMHKKLVMELNSIDIIILEEKVFDKILAANIGQPVG